MTGKLKWSESLIKRLKKDWMDENKTIKEISEDLEIHEKTVAKKAKDLKLGKKVSKKKEKKLWSESMINYLEEALKDKKILTNCALF